MIMKFCYEIKLTLFLGNMKRTPDCKIANYKSDRIAVLIRLAVQLLLPEIRFLRYSCIFQSKIIGGFDDKYILS
jgi:hypothetical protein